jgi:hypothetical protein
VPLLEGELHRKKLRSDKYKPSAGCLLEFYESHSSMEADEDIDDEAGGDAGTCLGAGGAAKPQRRIWSAVGKQSASSAAAAVSAVKATEKKKKRKRKATSPPAVSTPSIPTPNSREIESEDEEEDDVIEELPVTGDWPARRSESPAANRQRELVEKTSEAQRTVAAMQAKMPVVVIGPWLFRPKLHIQVIAK